MANYADMSSAAQDEQQKQRTNSASQIRRGRKTKREPKRQRFEGVAADPEHRQQFTAPLGKTAIN